MIVDDLFFLLKKNSFIYHWWYVKIHDLKVQLNCITVQQKDKKDTAKIFSFKFN